MRAYPPKLFPRPKIYHRAKHIAPDGRVSALCYARPRAIDLSRASWTIRDVAVTCPRCRRLLEAEAAKIPKP